MDVLELLLSRRSIRKYKSTVVEEEKIQQCLEAARWAPSASNKQPWEFIIVKDEKMRKKFAEIHPYAKFVAESPVVFVPLTNPEIHPKYHMSDTGLSILHFMIQAHALGLGTCWAGVIGTSFEPELKKLLNVPEQLNIMALVALGYPDQERESSRKSLDELVHWEKY
ncbi:MAG: nitroreductase family protein [Candidatus Heimdallarchaeota archaeon]|nr:nitroreductase family protein [Candidatus Heimdallarchaeota archaeon]